MASFILNPFTAKLDAINRGNVYFWGQYASDPSVSAQDGDFYWNTSDNNLLVYISGSWVSLGGSAPEYSYLLMETGDYLLTETGDKFILG